MKILIVSPYFYPSVGGVQTYVMNLAQGLKKSGHDVVVVSTAAKPGTRRIEREEILGLQVIRLPWKRKVSNTPMDFRWYYILKRIIKEEQPDVVNAHTPVPFLADMAARASKGTTFVLTNHAATLYKKDAPFANMVIRVYEALLGKKTFKMAQKVVTVSDYVKSQFSEKVAQKTEVIYNAIDIESTKQAVSDNSNHRIIFISTLDHTHAWKGLGYLIEAVAIAQKVLPDIELLVAGDGDMRAEYEAQAQQLGITRLVRFVGMVTGRQKLDLLASASSAVLYPDTANDALPTVLLEAWGAALPVIVADLPPLNTLVEDKITGLLAAPADPQQLAKKIIELFRSKSLRRQLSRNSLTEVHRKYSTTTMVHNTAELFARLSTPMVIQVAPYYPSHLGGMERVAQSLSENLAERGFDIQVLTSDIAIASADSDHLRVTRFKAFEFAHTPFAPGFIPAIFRIPKRSIIHLHLTQAFYPELVLLVSKLRGIPYIVHFHLDLQPSGPLGWLFKVYKASVIRMVIRHAASVVVFSRDQRAFVCEMYNLPEERIAIIPNGVGQEYFLHPRRYVKGPRKLLYVGRLSPQKRVQLLIRAMSLLRTKAELTIVGDGEDGAELKALAAELRLTNVRFVGAKTPAKLLEYYKQADVFVLASEREGMPLVLLEAMAAGLPIVGANVIGIRELIRGVGELVHGDSGRAFADKLDALLPDSKKLHRLSVASFETAKQYSWQQLTDGFSTLYKKVRQAQIVTTQRLRLLAATTLVWTSFLLLGSRYDNTLGLLNIVGFLALIIVPGLLTHLSLNVGRRLPFWYRLGQIVGLSVLELMVWTLACNAILPYLGVGRPLARTPLLWELSAMYGLIASWSWYRLRIYNPQLHWRYLVPSKLDIAALLVPVSLIVLSAIGSTSLNNGGTDGFTLAMLLLMAGYMGALLLFRKRLQDNTIAWAIFMMSLALLLMTSLRGWYVTGHDIQREYRVFQIAKAQGIWNIGAFRDPYNACLSITILPTILSNLLHVRDPYVYKVFFQLIFATVPVLVYLFMRRYLSKAKAFIATIYFISFPTFFTDMPFLNRQEIAFLFLILMLLVVFDGRIAIRKRQWLFIVFALGMVLSHYSTTYSVVSILLFLGFARLILYPIVPKLRQWRRLRQSSIEGLGESSQLAKPNITIPMIILVSLLCFTWNTVLTNTSNAASSLIGQTISSFTTGLKEDARSADVLYSIFYSGSINPQKELREYQQSVVNKARSRAAGGVFYSNNTIHQYPVQVAPQTILPLTDLGRHIQKYGINVKTVDIMLKQAWARLLQVFVVVGLIFTAFKKKFNKSLEPEFFLLTAGCAVFVFAQVVLPYLSIAYGLLRAFQQSLMILGLFVMVGTFALSAWLRPHILRNMAPAALALLFFLASTSAISQLLGGYQPELQLNNSGQYYDVYYMHTTEVTAINWLSGLVHGNGSSVQAEVQTDRYAFREVTSLTNLSPRDDITPGLIRQKSYVYLGYTDSTKHQATFLYNGDLVTYTYPIQFLDNNKNLIYNNGGARVYQ
ncbi:MAG TPA: glycosyltransferase [Candidatus Saccharimonadales bacterium]|nr:glycosyltransferase [Candidatus Saccharimonadales bacterium]